jgi:hypothetical protein
MSEPARMLHKMARAITSPLLPYDEAHDFLSEAFRMGKIAGKQEAYKAERRAKEARRHPGGQPHG